MTTRREGTAGGWLLPPRRTRPQRFRVFCWPYAGLGASVFVPWSRLAPEGIGIYGIQAPGRESRMSEPALRRIPDMVRHLTGAMMDEPGLFDAPYALLGCSFGAVAAFELARALDEAGVPGPSALAALACRSPRHVLPVGPFGQLDDDQLAEKLHRDYGGMPDILREEPDLLRVFMPTIRADLEAMEAYAPPSEDSRLGCPIHALGGVDDARVSKDVLEGWVGFGAEGSSARQIAGGHFMVRDDPDASLSAVLEALKPWLHSN